MLKGTDRGCVRPSSSVARVQSSCFPRRVRLELEPPPRPGAWTVRPVELGRGPGCAPVGRDLHAADSRRPGPRPAGEGRPFAERNHGAACELEGALHGLARERRGVGRVVRSEHAVRRRVPGREARLGRDLDLPQPLDARDPDPPRDDEAHGKAVVGWEPRPVHLVREQDVVERLVDRERPPDLAQVDAARNDVGVEALREQVDCVLGDPGALEHLRKRDAAPLGHADPAELPLRPGRGGSLLPGEEAAPVARALDERGQLLRGQPLQVAQGELDRVACARTEPQAVAEDTETPRGGVYERRRRVVADEEPLVRDLVAHVGERVPPCLGVRPEGDEPLGRQRLPDRRARRVLGGRGGRREPVTPCEKRQRAPTRCRSFLRETPSLSMRAANCSALAAR